MSYYNAIIRATDKRRSTQRAQERKSKASVFECEALDADFFDHDEFEVETIRENATRYAEAH